MAWNSGFVEEAVCIMLASSASLLNRKRTFQKLFPAGRLTAAGKERAYAGRTWSTPVHVDKAMPFSGQPGISQATNANSDLRLDGNWRPGSLPDFSSRLPPQFGDSSTVTYLT
jgi:hypothetical protein